MKLEEALEITVELAHQNVINPDFDDPALEGQAKRQVEALRICKSLLTVICSAVERS